MTELERKAWLAVAAALDSIDGFVGGPDQAQAIGNAMSAICDLLDDGTIRNVAELEAEITRLREALRRARETLTIGLYSDAVEQTVAEIDAALEGVDHG